MAYMRLSGHLTAETHPADRRITRLKPTEKLLETMRSRLTAQLESVAMVWPEIGGAVDQLESPDFVRELGLAFLRHFTSGPRLIDQAPELRLFLERNEGALILYALMLGADPAEPLPPASAVPLSIKALARQFRVSRTHVLRLVRDAEASGLLFRVGAKGEQVVFAPRLQEGLRKLFATMFQQSAVSAWTAMQAIAGAARRSHPEAG
jgi:DNA-binding MarR family transcriptional regulator